MKTKMVMRMKTSKGIAPALALAIIGATALGVVVPVSLAEMQHRGMVKITPDEPIYGVMKAGESVMGMYRFNKAKWNQERLEVREMERNELQRKCPECTEEMQQLEQERLRIEERIRTGYGTGEGTQTRTQTETRTQTQSQPQTQTRTQTQSQTKTQLQPQPQPQSQTGAGNQNGR